MLGTADREQAVFGAISHPARRRMLDLLVEADRSVNTIAGHFQMSRPAVSQHLRILLDAGLVTEQRHGRERRYRLVPARLGPVRDWIAHYERFWDDHLQRLQEQLSRGARNDSDDSKRDFASAAARAGLEGAHRQHDTGRVDVPE
jgi:DNA-binding transcriptional ArsR family regulator